MVKQKRRACADFLGVLPVLGNCCWPVLHSEHNYGGSPSRLRHTGTEKTRASCGRLWSVLESAAPATIRLQPRAVRQTKKAAAGDAAAFHVRCDPWVSAGSKSPPHFPTAPNRRGPNSATPNSARARAPAREPGRAWEQPPSSARSSWLLSSGRLSSGGCFLRGRLLGGLLRRLLARFLGGLLRVFLLRLLRRLLGLLGGLLLCRYDLLGLFGLLALLALLRFSHRDPPVAADPVCRGLRMVRLPRSG